MLQTSSKKIVDLAVSHGYIKEEQHEEYLYGLRILIDILINDITMLLIGILLGMLWECIVFWLAYKLLRKYCGGFHFSTSVKCYLSSCIMCPVALLCIRYIPYNALIWNISVLFTAALLFIISPVSAANKPLDSKEIIVFGRMARIVVICLSILYIAMTMLNIFIISKPVAMSIVCVSIFAVTGKIYLNCLHKNV